MAILKGESLRRSQDSRKHDSKLGIRRPQIATGTRRLATRNRVAPAFVCRPLQMRTRLKGNPHTSFVGHSAPVPHTLDVLPLSETGVLLGPGYTISSVSKLDKEAITGATHMRISYIGDYDFKKPRHDGLTNIATEWVPIPKNWQN